MKHIHPFRAGLSAVGGIAIVSTAVALASAVAVAADPRMPALKRNPVILDESKAARLIADMASDDPRKVLNALDKLEESQSPPTNVIGAARGLLPDPRPAVRKKAARVLGVIHAQVSPDDLKAISRMLKSYDKSEAAEALKALRGLNARELIPDIVPLLKSPHELVVRDACRTLAVLGSRELIPLIEPLLKHRSAEVRADADAAIAALEAKN